MQAPGHGHHNHVFDPALTHQHQHQPISGDDAQQQASSSTDRPSAPPALNPDGTSLKRRPGRPKGSTKKNLLAGSPLPPKVKRPVGRPRKDGFPAGSVGSRVKRERTTAPQAAHPVVSAAFSAPDRALTDARYTMAALVILRCRLAIRSVRRCPPRQRRRPPCSTLTPRLTGALRGTTSGQSSRARIQTHSSVPCLLRLPLPIPCPAQGPLSRRRSSPILSHLLQTPRRCSPSRRFTPS